MPNKIDKTKLQKYVDAAAAREGSSMDLARRVNEKYETGYSDKYVADLISQARGTARTRKEIRQGAAKPEPPRETEENPRRRFVNIDEIIGAYVSENPSELVKPLCRTMLREHPEIDYHVEHLAYLVREYKKRHKIETVINVRPIGGDEKYHVIDGTYKWKAKHGPISLPVELADQMFYEYSRHGLDLSQSQMRQKHDVKIWEWNSIKNTLFLYKDSNIISPYTEDNTPKEDLQKLIDDRMDLKMKDKQRLIESSYNKETIKRYKKVIEKDAVNAFALENMIDELNDITAEWKTKTATVKRTPDFKTERRWLVVTLADLHIGARVEGLRLTPEYNSDQARHLLDLAARRINAMRPTDVSLLFLGDLIESFTGMNHPNSWQSVEYGMIGARVIKEAISLIEEFIAKVDNVREILGVAGNHDRITASNKEDRRGQVAEIIFYMLQRLYGAEIQIEYSDLVLSRQIDGIQYVIAHNDKKVLREGKQIVIDYGDSKLFNVIIGAHVHNRKVLEDERSYRWVIAPALFTGNRHSEENAWFARPGILVFENDGSGKPTMTDYTL